MELPIPTSLVDRSLLTQFHMETMCCFTTEQVYQVKSCDKRVQTPGRFINGDLSQYKVHFPPDPLTPEGIRLTAGGVGLSTGYHTHSKA